MALDPRIPLGVQPLRLESPLDTAGQAMQIQAMQQRAQLGAMQMQQMRAAQAQQAELKQIAQASGGDIKGLIKGLYDRGHIEMAMGLEAKLAEREKVGLETQKARIGIAGEREKLLSGAFKFLGDNPSDERITSTLGGFVQRGELPPDVAQQFAGDLLSLPPQQRTQALVTLARTPEQFAALYTPKVQMVDRGDAQVPTDVNPNTNPNLGPIERRMSPAEIASDARGRQSNAISAGQLRVAQERLNLDRTAPRITNVVDTPSHGLVGVDARGGLHPLGDPGAPAGNVSVGEPMMAPGGPAGAAPAPGGAMPQPMPQSAPAAPRGAAPGPILSKAQAEAQAAAAKAEKSRAQTVTAAKTVLGKIDQALGQVNGWNAGAIGWARSFIPGTSARDLAATLETIQANLGFDRLQQMREASQTGGALGSITERELSRLEATLASLAIDQSPDQLARGLEEVRQIYGGIVGNLDAIAKGQTDAPRESLPAQPNTPQRVSGQIGGPPQSGSPTQRVQVDRLPMPRDVPVGAIATDENGRRFRNDGKDWVPMR